MAIVPFGSQFLVNGIPAGVQYRPQVMALANGGFVIGWQDGSAIGEIGDDVHFARYDAFGARLTAAGTNTIANTLNLSAQFEVSIGAFADGKFVMVWTDSGEYLPDADNRAVWGQIFNSNGTKSGVQFIVNATFPLSQDEPSVAVLSNGKFVVSWTSEIINASSTTDIIGRVFNANGTPSTAEFKINTQLIGHQDRSTVHALSTGGFAVVWDDREESPVTGNQTKTFIRFYAAGGAPASAALLANAATAGDPLEAGFAELSDGRIVLTYSDQDPLGTGDGSGFSIRARIYNPATAAFGAAINVNTTVSNDQSDAVVAALDGGQFVVAWTDNSKTGADVSFEAVRMQLFSSAGAKVGAELLVNGSFTFEQRNPAITVLKDGRFVVAWEDNSQTGGDTEAFAIRSRIYDARLAALDLDGSASADNFQGSAFNDVISGLAGADVIKGGGGGDLILGGIGIDLLLGEDGNDTLQGGDGDDTLQGGAGQDKLYGEAGADTLEGGPGHDVYYVTSALDVVVELPGQGTDTVNTTQNVYTLPANVEWLVFSGTGNFTGRGNAQSNKIYGGAGSDFFFMDGTGADAYAGLEGVDTVDFRLLAGATINFLTSVNAGSAAGDSFSNIERIYGSLAGADTLTGGGREAIYLGFGGNDALNGGTLADTLAGGDGNDTLKGNAANDVLSGGENADTMTGGAGADTFLFSETVASGGWGADSITDFADGVDKLKVENAVAASFAAFSVSGQGTATVTLTLAAAPANVITVHSAGGNITLSAADFLFY